MSTNVNIEIGPARRPDATLVDAASSARLERERALLDEARAELDGGLTVDRAEMAAWLDSLDGDNERPLPVVRRGY